VGVGIWDTQWEWEREVVVVAVQREAVVEESAGGDRRCTLKFYLSNLCVGNGNGRPVSCSAASRVIVKVTKGR
tara:strand:+ start:186 stop:404 length:219 start_codon:yes stop_codon:yes gene_type:complete